MRSSPLQGIAELSPPPASPLETTTEVRETHVSIIFLLGDRAYKLKRSVKFAFLDLTTPRRRRAACEKEVELNRRLAPDVYLGVAEVRSLEARMRDYLVVMRRMPASRRLASLVRRRAPVEEGLRDVARQIADLHSRQRLTPTGVKRPADAVRRRWAANFDELAPFAGTLLDPAEVERAKELSGRYIEGRRRLFAWRDRGGFQVDGHGDLLADDIFLLPDGARILDCLEFDDQLRKGDALADVTFLACDLERLGAPALARRFLGWYSEFSGTTHPPSLTHLYSAYAAQVRCKVACLREAQGAGGAKPAQTLLRLCLRHLEAARVRLVLVGGLPGTGKSELASSLSRRLGYALVSTDAVRQEIIPAAARAEPAAYQQGAYSRANVTNVYRQALARARTALELGESVILDATWSTSGRREAAARLARATGSELVELRCVTPGEVARERIVRRLKSPGRSSQATLQVAEQMARRWEAWGSAAAIDTSGSRRRAVSDALAIIAAR